MLFFFFLRDKKFKTLKNFKIKSKEMLNYRMNIYFCNEKL